MARMPSSCATSGTSSTSSLTKWAPVNSSENLWGLSISFCLPAGESRYLVDGRRETYLTTWGAMTLQGPHQVAKASRTTTLLSLRAASNSTLLFITSVSHHCLADASAALDAPESGRNIPGKIVDTHFDSWLLESACEVVVDGRICSLGGCSEKCRWRSEEEWHQLSGAVLGCLNR
jgi:hypothetical protein